MKLSTFKELLSTLETIQFQLENGTEVPANFHVTEVGKITKDFIDCGGVIRHEQKVNFQLWAVNDVDHRLLPNKLRNIIQLSENKLGIEDVEIEVEYQGETIGKYDLRFENDKFILQAMHTNCLANDHCGILPKHIPNVTEETKSSSCTPGGSCC